jgi:hypothetical protein
MVIYLYPRWVTIKGVKRTFDNPTTPIGGGREAEMSLGNTRVVFISFLALIALACSSVASAGSTQVTANNPLILNVPAAVIVHPYDVQVTIPYSITDWWAIDECTLYVTGLPPLTFPVYQTAAGSVAIGGLPASNLSALRFTLSCQVGTVSKTVPIIKTRF